MKIYQINQNEVLMQKQEVVHVDENVESSLIKLRNFPKKLKKIKGRVHIIKKHEKHEKLVENNYILIKQGFFQKLLLVCYNL